MDIKSINIDNEKSCPFPMPSGEASAEWFIGRKDIISQIIKDAIHPNGEMTNYSIIGLPRMGKSSLLKLIKKNDVIFNKRYCKLVVIYLSLDQCGTSLEMWREIGHKLAIALKRKFSENEDFTDFKSELHFRDISLDTPRTECNYTYLCELAEVMKEYGYRGIIMIDEFDKFSDIADRTIVGNFRTIFNGVDYGIRVILASRRTVERIEAEVKDAVNANVSTLSPLFTKDCTIYLQPFSKSEIEEYWREVSNRIDHDIAPEYKDAVVALTGGHPMLLNLLNHAYWKSMPDEKYLWEHREPDFNNLLIILHQSFKGNIWDNIERWGLHTALILHTWGPICEEDPNHIIDLTNYGVFDDTLPTNPIGSLSIAISKHFTEWLNIKRYELPFTDVWSIAERNLRSLIKRYCADNYMNDEESMFNTIIANADFFERDFPEKHKPFTAQSRIEKMKKRRFQKKRKYPDMSEWAVDYSEPSDIPEIFIKRDWKWFVQVFNGQWVDWENRFLSINEIRNIHSHNNDGVPKARVDIAKKYCQEVNILIEHFLNR
ncbi:MAG: ATP-binding protein [Muribaculaceae bacterium]|nr:ATP-binding protein [Muribaculaceae bacterium]